MTTGFGSIIMKAYVQISVQVFHHSLFNYWSFKVSTCFGFYNNFFSYRTASL